MKMCLQKSLRIGVLFLALCCGSSAFAQRIITGTVVDSTTNEPLLGATVVVKEDKTKGAVTDFDGKFRLSVPNNATAILVSFTGFNQKEVRIDGQNNVSVALVSGQILQDVVIIGYGTVKREDATGVVQSVSADKFNRGAITGPQDLLAGKIAGVVVTPGNGAPGEGATIRVRGESSLGASSDPLIVVDGVPLGNGGASGSRNQLNSINPNDIETFTVLKDASAAAIYGNRASGGVILITTKKGKSDKTRFGYSANVSMGEVTKYVDVLDANEFRSAVDLLPMAQRDAALELIGDANTNWQKEIYQKAFGTDHNFYVSGGLLKVPYRVSVGYTDKAGVLKTDHFDRWTTSVNLSPSYFDNTLQLNINYKRMVSHNRFANRGAIGTAAYFDPTHPVYDETSPYSGYWEWQENTGAPRALAPKNPLAQLYLRDDRSLVNQRILSSSIDYRLPFFRALRLNLTLGLDRSNGVGRVLVPGGNVASFAYNTATGGGESTTYEGTRTNKLLENYLNYKESFGRHSFDIMLGHSWQQFLNEEGTTRSSANGQFGFNGGPPAFNETAWEYFLLSQFARLNYGFNERILLTGSIRRDGTSRFSELNRWGLFPAGALAVKLVDNNKTFLHFVKARLGFGVTGQQELNILNDQLNYYPHLSTYQGSIQGASYQFGNQYFTTIRPNPYFSNVKWEETTTYNAGMDFSIIRDRLSGALDVYKRYTKDLLQEVPALPALSNLSNRGVDNIGEMETEGVELGLNFSPVSRKSVQWDVATNISYNQYELTKLYGGNPLEVGGIAGGVGSNIQIHAVGYAPFTFHVKKQLYDADGRLLEGQFQTNPDGDTATLGDFYYAQNSAPRFTFGITNNLRLNRWMFSFAGRANFGQYMYNNVQSDAGYIDRVFNSSGFVANMHQSGLDLNVYQQGNLTFSDYFVQKADFFRMDHITVSYAVPVKFASNLSFTATVQNPFVITSYDGLDPEIFRGIDNSFYPRPRTYVFGVQADF